MIRKIFKSGNYNRLPCRLALTLLSCLALSALISCDNPLPPSRVKYAEDILRLYRSMRVGDWTFYKLTDSISVWLQVMETNDDYVAIKRQSYIATMPSAKGFTLKYRFDEIEKNLLAGKDLNGKMEIEPRKASNQTVSIGKRTYNCGVYRVRTPGAVIETYRSDEAPLDGVVTVKRNGVVIRALIASGRAGQPIPRGIAPPTERNPNLR